MKTIPGMGEHDYFAAPDAPNGRGLILIPEYWGLVDHIRDVARRFATEGFEVLALDLFEGKTTDDPTEGRAFAASIDTERVLDRLQEAAVDMASRVGGSERVGVVGWCMGGTLAFRAAAANLPVGAVVGFYGRSPGPEGILRARMPVLGIFGSDDHVYPVEDVRAQAAILRTGPGMHRFVVCHGGHAFFNDTRDTYDEDAAGVAWELALAWLRHSLA